MNHLRELLDTPPETWLVPLGVSDGRAFALADDLARFGARATCFWLGEIENTDGLRVIPELCRLPFDVCWFEIACTSGEKTWRVAMLAIQTSAGVRVIGFRRSAGTWELRYVAGGGVEGADAEGRYGAIRLGQAVDVAS